MGTEISLPENRTVSLYHEELRNNYRPLHFHQVHGDNVKLSKNGRVASRSEGFSKGIVFSDRPVMVCEPIYIKFVDISSNWSGALRIGFTMNDPISMKSKLPKYACPDLTALNGNWAKAISEKMAKKDSVLFYFVDQNGDVHYGLDSKEHGVFYCGVNISGKLWAVLDIYGNTVAIEFVNPNSFNPNINESPNNSTAINRNREIPNSSGGLISEVNTPLSFHTVHGKDVVLNGAVASRKSTFDSLAYVFLERPLKLGEKVAVEIVQTNRMTNGNLVYGITSCDPSILSPRDLPKNADDLMDRPEYWIVKYDSNSYESGDIIACIISIEGEVSVTKNNERFAVFHVDPTQPLWLFLNIIGLVSEVRLLGSLIPDQIGDITNRLTNMKVSLPAEAKKKDSMPGPSSQSIYTECAICCEKPVDCALYRCGHMCMCYSCALKMWKPGSNVQCPLCRVAIQDVIKIYR